MKRIYITFSGHRYPYTTGRIVEGAIKYGADKLLVYDDVWLREKHPEFIAKIKHLLDHKEMRGYGWFAWKPYVILDALQRFPEATILYTDADTFPIHDLKVLFDIGERDGIMLFEANGWTQKQWCTQACFKVMGLNPEEYYDKCAGCARFMVFTKKYEFFLNEWLNYCLDIRATTFDPRPEFGAEHSEFRQHRTEQAILTNLGHKYKLKFYREACEFGNSSNNDKELYPQLFVQLDAGGQIPDKIQGSQFRNV